MALITFKDEGLNKQAGPMQSPSRMTRLLFCYLFPGALILTGGLTLFLGLREMEAAQTSTTWPTVSGTVKSSDIDWSNNDSDDHQRDSAFAKVVYTYQVAGHLHTSDKVLYGDYGSSDSSHADSIVSQYAPGQAVTVHYDPADPSTAVLQPGINGGCLFLPIFGGAFLLVGLLLALFLPSVLASTTGGVSNDNRTPGVFPPTT
jgi:hypothetical protein